MDTRTLTTVLLRILGLFVFCNALFDLPAYFIGPFDGSRPIPAGQRFAQAVVALLLPFVFGFLLWFFPGRVVNRIVVGADQVGTFGTREFERVALTVLGAWLAVYGALEALGSLLNIYFGSRDHPGPLPGVFFIGPIVALFKLAIGIALMVGAPTLQHALHRVRSQA